MNESVSNMPVTRRGRGRPPLVSRTAIIEAAREIPLDDLSMQAVADRLGVDRSTINYHFANRDELFSLVASATLGLEMAGYQAPESDDWRDWVAAYMRSVHAALIAHSTIALYVRLPLGNDHSALAPVEGTIQKLYEAGFDAKTVAHAIGFMSEVVHITAQNEILVSHGSHPQSAELGRYLDEQPEGSAPGLRGLLALEPTGTRQHFDFAVQMVITGLDNALQGLT